MVGFSGHWVLVFGLLGNVISFMVYLAPIPTFRKIYKKKSSEGFQSIPYVVALFSSMLWIYYAFLKPNTTLIFTINSVGCFIETIYIAVYFFYAKKKSKIQTLKLVGIMVFAFGSIFLGTHFLVKASLQCGKIVGWICLVFSLCVFVAPLGVVRRVIRTKSVEYMPFLLSLCLTLSAVVWFFYGLLLEDFNIAIPNVLGFAFGVLQMVLYVIYRNVNKISEEKLPEIIADRNIPNIQEETSEKNAVEVQNQAIVLDENKITVLVMQMIEMVKQCTLKRPEQIPIVSPLPTKGIEASHTSEFTCGMSSLAV